MHDLIVVGGGSGGLSLSKRAACLYGKRVLLVDRTVLGGTCVNTGCIPKKMLYNAANLHAEARVLYRSARVEFKWAEFKEKRSVYIEFLNGMYTKRNQKDGVDTVTGDASIKDGAVEVNGVKYSAETVVLAMGSKPRVLEVKGKEHFLTSNDFFMFESVPKSVLIVGTGYIAVETAFVLAEFGCKVTLVARRTGVLRAFDEVVQREVHASLLSKGIQVLERATVSSMEAKNGEVRVTLSLEDGQKETKVTAEKVICATGRVANTEAIHMQAIKADSNGFVCTNKTFKTTVDGVYAIGDITMEKYMLTPVAIFCGRRLADYLYGNTTDNIKKLVDAVPTVVFSHPPAGSVGYAKEDSEIAGKLVSVECIETFHPLSIFSDRKNAYKFVFDSETSELYGVHVHGAECDEILQGYAALVRSRIKYADMKEYTAKIGGTMEDILSGVFE
ncbi:glutathione reductase (NADPH) [Nematocida major]|uniref:glutathione reductase (NADPH) n=1 Tax=Nematocida major TaxID=1912982 RepID=UPI0020072665|nr:glutathione reductase (NADPH) [Nematocida major]KAH9385243.1 glutathione reductase (NADPH) [Nematocida major]